MYLPLNNLQKLIYHKTQPTLMQVCFLALSPFPCKDVSFCKICTGCAVYQFSSSTWIVELVIWSPGNHISCNNRLLLHMQEFNLLTAKADISWDTGLPVESFGRNLACSSCLPSGNFVLVFYSTNFSWDL